ncbi:MAG TPA: 16S rRNA (cytidine(1402)-2'-O)-methyltransferase [Candidatus Omnitrophica bacterium]|nr:16S rRNA (cytidine(1402)-2'-O)-methyltransferase [Candidatus Omnitrophota bacterium]
MLYLIATPIGNLQDITLRALTVLREVDFILAEDTRRSGLLLKYHNLPKKPFISFFEHNEEKRLPYIISLLKKGKRIALLSNAGTPCISDPGYKLVRRCYQEGIKVDSLPGPSAVINALLLSGFPTDSFFFLGFLPRKKGELQKKLLPLKEAKTTLIIFESPQRIKRLLIQVRDVLGEKKCAVVREMTKFYQEVKIGYPEELLTYFEKNPPRGEVTVIVDTRSSKD